jgi:hypothetical protein
MKNSGLYGIQKQEMKNISNKIKWKGIKESLSQIETKKG